MKKSKFILAGFILLKFLLQYFLISPEYNLQRDEYLYLDQAHHLDWGYLSVPPFTSWISYIIYFLGNSFFWIKFFPALFGALTIIVVWKAIEEIKGNLFAMVLGATCILFSSLLRLNILYQPNSFDVLSWTSFYFIIIKYFNTEKTKYLFIALIVFALGFLNKYNIIFLLLGFFPALLLDKQRIVLFQKNLYFALLLGIIIILPNLIWQYKNEYPVVDHLRELAETQLLNVDRLDFIKSQALYFINSILVIFFGLYALMFYKPFKKYKLFFYAFFFTLIIFLYFKAKAYYALGLYPIYIVFGSVYLANSLVTGWKKHVQPALIVLVIIGFYPTYKIAFPNKSPEYIVEHSRFHKKFGLLRWEDGKDHKLPQDFADMLGWKELAKKVDSIYLKLPNINQTLVLCDNYGQAGAINYYSKEGIQAVSFSADYVNWFNLDKQYKNLIRVKNYEEKDNEFRETSPYFDSAVLGDSITNQYSREYKTKIFVFTKSKVDINKRIKEEIEEVKNYR